MTKVKATKKLTDIDFSGKNAAVALVGKAQGGAANNFTTLLIKSAKYTDEHVEKAAKIKVTLDIEEFLVRFYHLMYDDAEVLARALGFDTAEEDMTEDEAPQTYEDWITSRVEAIEVLKQLEKVEDIKKALSDLDPEEHLSVLRSQQTLEEAFKVIDESLVKNSKDTLSEVSSEEGTPTAVAQVKEVGKAKDEDVSSSKTKLTEKSKMTVKTTARLEPVETVEKSQFETIEKALETKTVELEKALEKVKQFELEKSAAIQKSRKQALKVAVKDDTKVDTLMKGLANVESEEVFQEVVKALESLTIAEKNSSLFKEQGFSSESSTKTEETALMKAVKAEAAKAKSTK